MPNYIDPAAWLCDVLAGLLPTGPNSTFRRWLTEVPDDLANPAWMPVAVVNRFGGADTHPGLDVARLDIDIYTTGPNPVAARTAALDRAEDVRRVIRLTMPGRAYAGVAVSRVGIISAPTIRPFDSRNQIRRSHQAVQLHLHRPI